MLFILLPIIILFGFVYNTAAEDKMIIGFVIAFILLIILSFTSLNVIVDKKYLRVKFGYGLFRKKFILREISKVEIVKNKWYYGYGIRYWPGMLIFNVSGFDAVEIVLKNGKVYRIGSDDVANLERAIINSIK